MNTVKLVIFDLDGTLVDAYGAIIRSFNHTMRVFGYPARKGALIRRAVGWGDRLLLKPFVLKKDLQRALSAYRTHHAQALRTHTRLLPGVKRALERLKKSGCRLAIATNRPTRFTGIIVKHLGLDAYIEYVLCADRLPTRKPHPLILRRVMRKIGVTPRQTVYVGDMALDAQTARRAGVRGVIVATGSSSVQEIRKEKPYKLLHSMARLPGLILK